MSVPFFYWLHEQPHDYYRFTEFGLRKLLESVGLTITLLEPMGGVPEIMADMFAKSVRRFKRLGAPLGLFAQWSAGTFTKTRVGRRISQRTSRHFPIGYFVVATRSG